VLEKITKVFSIRCDYRSFISSRKMFEVSFLYQSVFSKKEKGNAVPGEVSFFVACVRKAIYRGFCARGYS
jgi:hypothetical protein